MNRLIELVQGWMMILDDALCDVRMEKHMIVGLVLCQTTHVKHMPMSG